MTWTNKQNERRCELIDRKIETGLNIQEDLELNTLQKAMLKNRQERAPLPVKEAKDTYNKLKYELFKTDLEKLRAEDNLASTCAIRIINELVGIELEEHHWPIIEQAAIILAQAENTIDHWHHKYTSVISTLQGICKQV